MNHRFRLISSLRAVGAAAAIACVPQAHALEFTWSGGDYIAAGLPNPLGSGDIVNAVAGPSKTFTGDIVNNGRINWLSTNSAFFAANSTLRNNGTFDQQADGSIAGNITSSLFDNAGTLKKTGGSGDLTINVALNNHAGAVLEAGSGRIVYRNDSVFEAETMFNGAGQHVLSGVSRTFTFGGSFGGQNNLVFETGSYNATALTKPQADITFLAGTMTGLWNIDTGRTLTALPAGTSKTISGSFVNDGTVVWRAEGPLNLATGSTILRNNGTFDQQTDGSISGSTNPLFDNAGTFKKTGGIGDLTINVALNNRAGAVLEASSGRIVYRNDSVFEAATLFNGAGQHVLSGVSRAFTFGGSFGGQNNLVLESGTYNATALTKPQTDITFLAGTMTGLWNIDTGRTLTALPAGTSKTISGSFVNDGTIAWKTESPLNLATSTTTLRNNGTFDQQTDGAILGNTGPLFDNAGTLRKTGGSGNLRITTALINTGAIETLSGTIVLPSNWRNDGTLRGDAAFQTNVLTNAGDVAPGLPDPAAAMATLTLTGALIETATGTLSFDVTTAGLSDVLNVSGAVTFGGVVRVFRFGDYMAQIGDTFRVMNFAGFSGSVGDVQEFGFGSGVEFEALYSPSYLELRVTAVPEPHRWALLAGGLVPVLRLHRRAGAERK